MRGDCSHGPAVSDADEGSFVFHLVDNVEIAYDAVHGLKVSTKQDMNMSSDVPAFGQRTHGPCALTRESTKTA